jgi:hypothetical protein
MPHGGLTPDAVRRADARTAKFVSEKNSKQHDHHGRARTKRLPRAYHAGAGHTGIVVLQPEVCADSTTTHTRNVRGASARTRVRTSGMHT